MSKPNSHPVAEPNHSALQHAGLALVLILVIALSLIEMARLAVTRASTMPDIVRID